MFRIGFGNDIHRLLVGRPLVIGGISVESELGADGHSDADVLLHAITDAILGAMALGDIGTHFPNSDPQWKNAASSFFLKNAAESAKTKGYSIVNLDSTISLEQPKLRSYIGEIRDNIANLLEIDISCVSVKAKTGEGVDAVGKGQAIKADAVVLLTSG